MRDKMAVTEEEYKAASKSKDDAEKVINQFFKEQAATFKARHKRVEAGTEFYKDEDLIYSGITRCKGCGSGLAYPKHCGGWHYWDCADTITGRKERGDKCYQYDFSSYSIHSEQQKSRVGDQTTRPK